ncbi:MAG: LysR family transcriptional regulator [Firmicutes bacterium]|nr:LysR family transcriptional regulator [Bacillota bacterium]
MTIYQLELFVTLAHALNFTKASRLMHITQPAFSRHISSLEEELGIILFDRNKRSVELTAPGKVFLSETKKLLRHYNKGIMLAQQANTGQSGNLSLGFLESTSSFFMPNFIRGFHDTYPKIHLKFDEFNHIDLNEALSTNEVDVAFTTATGIDLIPHIAKKLLFEDYHYIAMHRDHPLASKDSINLSLLEKEPFVIMHPHHSDQGYYFAMQICITHGFTPMIAAEARFINSLLFLIDCKIGIGLLPKHLQHFASPNLRFIPIENHTDPIEVVVAWKNNNSNPCLVHFIKELENYLSNQ